MSRRLMTFAVCAVSLIAGACAGKIHVTAGLLSSTTVTVEAPAPAEVLAVRSLSFSELMASLDSTAPIVDDAPAPLVCELSDQIHIARDALKPLVPSVGSAEFRYTEHRAGGDVKFTDPEKQIILALLDPESCSIETVAITKRGAKLIAPNGYDIEAVSRANGITWNNWATEFRVNKPEGRTVIALKYPLVQDGLHRTVIPVYFTPYSRELHVPELVRDGEVYLHELALRAYRELDAAGVLSLAMPGSSIAGVSALKPQFLERLAPNEHMDLTEFLLDPAWTTERIHIVIGTNGDNVATYTCSKASACGLMQFTFDTYHDMARLYPKARLLEDFKSGAQNPLNAMKAAALLHDYNYAQLLGMFGPSISRDTHLEEYLAAAYNTGVGRVAAVISVARLKKESDWAEARGDMDGQRLLEETKGYIAKLRYLRDGWSQPSLADVVGNTPD